MKRKRGGLTLKDLLIQRAMANSSLNENIAHRNKLNKMIMIRVRASKKRKK